MHVYSETMPYFDRYMKVYEEEMKMNTGDLDTLSFTSVDQVEHRLSTPLVQTYLGNFYHYMFNVAFHNIIFLRTSES